jgi:hypothetical protein
MDKEFMERGKKWSGDGMLWKREDLRSRVVTQGHSWRKISSEKSAAQLWDPVSGARLNHRTIPSISLVY